MSELIRLRIRVYVAGKTLSDETFEHTLDEFSQVLPKLAEQHANLCCEHPAMVEIEFLDEPDPLTRYFRLGTDPLLMVDPIPVEEP